MRTENWPTLLASFVAGRRYLPFDLASNNCGFMASDWIRLLTGKDPASSWRSLTATGVARRLKKENLLHYAEDVAIRNKWPTILPVYAQRGDVVLVDIKGTGPALGVCLGAQSVFPGKESLTFLPTLTCQRAWRIN